VLKKIYRGMAHVIVNLRQNKKEIEEDFDVPPEQVSVIPVGDLLAFLRDGKAVTARESSGGRRVVLFFGIIEPRKGLLVLIHAFAAIRERVPGAFLHIVGKPYEDTGRYLAEIERLGLSDSVRFDAGYVPLVDVPAVFESADVVVLPYEEGWSSGVVLSAYGFGKPVVATTIGGLPELIEEGKTGFLVPPGDAAALAGAVARIIADDDTTRLMKKEIAEVAKKTSWPEIARLTEAIYAGASQDDLVRFFRFTEPGSDS